jgi:hypothetical protein
MALAPGLRVSSRSVLRLPVLLGLVAAALAPAPRALAAQASAISVEELARTSDAVVRGKVISSHPHRREDGRIFTVFDVRTRAVLRGHAPPVAHVDVPGGILGRTGERVDGAPRLVAGEELILFLRRAGPETFVVAELAQGKFTVDGDQARPDLSRFTFSQTSVPPGERRAEEMPVTELERRVRTTR